MGYEDFVWFIMSEEDKSSEMALDYWFKCCDLDGDGCLRANEMLVSFACCCVALFAPSVLLTKPCPKAHSEVAKKMHKHGTICLDLLKLHKQWILTASEAPSCYRGDLKHAGPGVEPWLAASLSHPLLSTVSFLNLSLLLQFFYSEQLHRMECLSQEPVLFEDVLCQMHDMIQPAKEGCFTLADLNRHKQLAGTLFNMLFNLHKFIAFETRDPFLARQVRRWDR